MLALKILSGELAGTEFVACQFPFRVGRSKESDLALEGPGLHQQHLVIELGDQFRFQISTAQPKLLLSINGQQLNTATLRNGDVIEIGTLKLQATLTPTRQANYKVQELLIWGGLILVLILQIFLILGLQR